MRPGSLIFRQGSHVESRSIMVVTVVAALVIGLAVGLVSPSIGVLVGGACMLGIILVLRQDQFTAAVVVAISLLQDWYRLIPLPVTFPVVSIAIALALIALIFFDQSAEHPWVHVPLLWAWLLLLVLAAPHILQGISRNESVKYFAQVYANGLVMWILGMQVVRNTRHLRVLLALLSSFGTFIAVHSIIISLTGMFLFETPTQLAYLSSVSNFHLSGTTESRAGSFIGSPDWNGTLMAIMIFLPLALFVTSRSRWAKAIFGVQLALIVLALFFTYSTGAWLATGVGIIVFAILTGFGARSKRQLLFLLAAVIATPLVPALAFPRQFQVLIGHFTASGQLSLRIGAWTTAARIIMAYPLTGIGLGWSTYLDRAAPFRVKEQIIPLAHPHDAYLEVGAMAGIPVLIVLLVVFVLAFRLAFRAYRAASGADRVLLGGAFASLIALTFNSISVNAWTLQPLAAFGWLLAGALASPALYATLRKDAPSENTATAHANMTEFAKLRESGQIG